jgi:hypothetical protein
VVRHGSVQACQPRAEDQIFNKRFIKSVGKSTPVRRNGVDIHFRADTPVHQLVV